MKKLVVISAAVIALSAVALLSLEDSEEQTAQPSFDQRLDLERAAASPEAAAGLPAASVARAAEEAVQPTQEPAAAGRAPATLHPPSLTEVRAEVERDPHSTPESIIRFAQGLAPAMETALASEPDARALQPKLARCARDSEVDSTAALCLVNSKRLADKYASLRQDYAKLASDVRPVVASLERAVTLATQ